MATIACDICGGTLSMDASGDFAVCDSCGMKHTKDRIKAMAQEVTGTVAVSNIASIESLMKRGRLELEDSHWGVANEYFDKVLDIDPEYAPAYIGKLCAELEVEQESLLGDYIELLTYYSNFEKAVRFADTGYRAQIEGYNKIIQERIAVKTRKEQDKECIDRERAYKNLEPIRSYKSLVAAKKEETEKKDAELRKKYNEDMKIWQENVSRMQQQSNIWRSQKLCPHCGGKIGLFSKTCKVCNKESTMPLDIPVQPEKPDYSMPKFNISDILQSICVSFGGYNWLVLDIQNKKALLLSKESIGEKRFHHTYKCNVTWDNCELKKYLNGDFFQKFNAAEKAMIDYEGVFLLSEDEVNKYFGAKENEKNPNFTGGRWWLRTTMAGRIDIYGNNNTYASYFPIEKDIYGTQRHESLTCELAVRPALWIRLQ